MINALVLMMHRAEIKKAAMLPGRPFLKIEDR
jgi:hypothetical protein